eukprot:499604_1
MFLVQGYPTRSQKYTKTIKYTISQSPLSVAVICMDPSLVVQLDVCISILERAIAEALSIPKDKASRHTITIKKHRPPSVARYIKIHLVDPERFVVEFSTPKRIGQPRPLYYDISINNHVFKKVVTQNRAYPHDCKADKQKPFSHKIRIENCTHNRRFKIIVMTYNDKSQDTPTKSNVYKIQTCANPSAIQHLQMKQHIISWEPPVYKSFGDLVYELMEITDTVEGTIIATTKQCSINIESEYKDKNYQNKQWMIRTKEQKCNYSVLSPLISYNIGAIKTKRFTTAKNVMDIQNAMKCKALQLTKFKHLAKPQILKDISKIQLIDRGAYLQVPTDMDPSNPDVLTIMTVSDTHTKHKAFRFDALPPADLVLHAGDFTFDGRESEVRKFNEWGQFLASLNINEDKNSHLYHHYYGKKSEHKEASLEPLDIKERKYKYLVCIAGNHETTFDVEWYEKDGSNGQRKHQYFKPKPNAREIKQIITQSKYWTYLEDSAIQLYGLKIYGAPWQPFYNDWAFNLPRHGNELYDKWQLIPKDTDILVSHGPPFGHGDKVAVAERGEYSGDQHLMDRVKTISNISHHVFGHVHSGFGCTTQKHIKTLFINASSVNHSYAPAHKPIVFHVMAKESD